MTVQRSYESMRPFFLIRMCRVLSSFEKARLAFLVPLNLFPYGRTNVCRPLELNDIHKFTFRMTFLLVVVKHSACNFKISKGSRTPSRQSLTRNVWSIGECLSLLRFLMCNAPSPFCHLVLYDTIKKH